MGIANKYHLELLAELKKHAGKGTRYQSKRGGKYSGTSKYCHTIQTGIKRKIVRDWLKKNPGFSSFNYMRLLDSLFQGESHDEISLGGKFLKQAPQLRRDIEPMILDKWLSFVEGWSEVDSICQSTFTAKEVLSKWNKWKTLLTKLAKDKNIHKKRASLVLLTKPVRDSSDSRLADLSLKNIETLKAEKDILVTKAISWLLRDLIKNHKERVEEYLQSNASHLPKIAVRETRNKLLKGQKQ